MASAHNHGRRFSRLVKGIGPMGGLDGQSDLIRSVMVQAEIKLRETVWIKRQDSQVRAMNRYITIEPPST